MSTLTARACEGAKPHSDRDRLLGDGDGLFLRIRPHGTKTWVVEYEFRGIRRKPTIGVFSPAGALGESITDWLDYGRLSLAQARSIAAQWKQDRRGGRDPVAEWEARLSQRRAQEEAVRRAAEVDAQAPTVREAAKQFITKHIMGKKSANAICYRLNCLMSHLGEKKIRGVSRQDVIAALERIGEGRTNGKTAKQLAGEVLVQAKRLWRFAETREWVYTSCIAPLSRKDFDARPNKRDVTLHLDELAELWRALDDQNRCKADDITVAALRLMILTGQREREVTDAEWSEFDLDAGLWKIPASRTKKGRAHLVHVAPQAAAILTQLKPFTGKERHVFASPLRKGQAIYGRSVNNALQLMFKRGQLPNVTHCHVHDLRRTLITRLPDLGFEPFIGHKIANHVLPGVLAHYNHAEYLQQREAALRTWAERIDALAADKKIVQLHRVA
jgi:integrase